MPYEKLSAKEETALNSISTQVNFEIPLNDISKRNIFIRYAIKEFYKLISAPVKKTEIKKAFLLNDNKSGLSRAIKILQSNNIEEKIIGLNVSDLAFRSNKYKTKVAFQFLTLIFLSPFYKGKIKSKQNFLGLPKAFRLYFLVNSQIIEGPRKAYIFGSYRPETNLISLLLQQYGINTSLFVSSTPLVYFFNDIICNTLLISSPYQIDEIKAKCLKRAYFDDFKLMKPLKAESLTDYYIEEATVNNTICIYTSGIWKRQKDKLPYPAEMTINEKSLFLYLSKFIKDNNVDILICLHPIEKSTLEDFEYSKSYYYNLMPKNHKVRFLERTYNSSEFFSSANISISIFSNVVMERLYCGHKAIFVLSEGDGKFPVLNSSFNNIIATNYFEFQEKLKKYFEMNNNEFFNGLKLNQYHHLTYGIDI